MVFSSFFGSSVKANAIKIFIAHLLSWWFTAFAFYLFLSSTVEQFDLLDIPKVVLYFVSIIAAGFIELLWGTKFPVVIRQIVWKRVFLGKKDNEELARLVQAENEANAQAGVTTKLATPKEVASRWNWMFGLNLVIVILTAAINGYTIYIGADKSSEAVTGEFKYSDRSSFEADRTARLNKADAFYEEELARIEKSYDAQRESAAKGFDSQIDAIKAEIKSIERRERVLNTSYFSQKERLKVSQAKIQADKNAAIAKLDELERAEQNKAMKTWEDMQDKAERKYQTSVKPLELQDQKELEDQGKMDKTANIIFLLIGAFAYFGNAILIWGNEVYKKGSGIEEGKPYHFKTVFGTLWSAFSDKITQGVIGMKAHIIAAFDYRVYPAFRIVDAFFSGLFDLLLLGLGKIVEQRHRINLSFLDSDILGARKEKEDAAYEQARQRQEAAAQEEYEESEDYDEENEPDQEPEDARESEKARKPKEKPKPRQVPSPPSKGERDSSSNGDFDAHEIDYDSLVEESESKPGMFIPVFTHSDYFSGKVVYKTRAEAARHLSSVKNKAAKLEAQIEATEDAGKKSELKARLKNQENWVHYWTEVVSALDHRKEQLKLRA